MKWNYADTVERPDEIADHMKAYDPSGGEVFRGPEYQVIRAARRRTPDAAELAAAVAEARAAGTTWERLGEILGIEAGVAEQQFEQSHSTSWAGGCYKLGAT